MRADFKGIFEEERMKNPLLVHTENENICLKNYFPFLGLKSVRQNAVGGVLTY